MERRLAAILSADVVGYTALMGADEAGTLRRLTELRREVLEPLITAHHGRIVKLMGDGLLVEFASVVDSIDCALTWQEAVAKRQVVDEASSRLRFRIGINLGDIIVEGGDIHGDGVNIAARLEGLAKPGEICLSDDAYRHAKGKTEAVFEDMGEQNLKNIAEPIRVYRVAAERSAAVSPTLKRGTLPLPERPCIAILPFDNMSRDPEQEYFSEGVSEDIITELSRFREFAVIARNSSFAYKGQPLGIKAFAAELGADYVVEGSVRKSGNRIRVTAQLIAADSGAHLWADRFDRELADIFTLQDEVTVAIVTAIAPRSIRAEVHRTETLSEAELNSWDLVLKARHFLGRRDKDSTHEAQRLLERAIELDARNAQAYCWLGNAYMIGTMYGWYEDFDAAKRAANSAVRKAVALDREDAVAYAVLAGALAYLNHEVEPAIEEAEQALHLNQNLAFAYGTLSGLLSLKGDLTVAREHLNKAMRLSPRDPDSSLWMVFFNVGAFSSGMDEVVVEYASRAIRMTPDYPAPYRQRAASLALLGRMDEARQDIDRLLELMPEVTVRKTAEQLPFFPNLERFLDGLRKAGLAEG